jgi:hypothetical protein
MEGVNTPKTPDPFSFASGAAAVGAITGGACSDNGSITFDNGSIAFDSGSITG